MIIGQEQYFSYDKTVGKCSCTEKLGIYVFLPSELKNIIGFRTQLNRLVKHWIWDWICDKVRKLRGDFF